MSNAPAATHAVMSVFAFALLPPPGGMFPPNHVRQLCCVSAIGLDVPLRYPALVSVLKHVALSEHFTPLLLLEWQPPAPQLPGEPAAK